MVSRAPTAAGAFSSSSTFVTTFPPLEEIDVAGLLNVPPGDPLLREGESVGSCSSSRVDEDETLDAGGDDCDGPSSLDAEPEEPIPEVGFSESLLDDSDDEADEPLPEDPSSALANPAPASSEAPTPTVIAPAPSHEKGSIWPRLALRCRPLLCLTDERRDE